MNQILIGEIAGAIAFVQIVPYVVSILRGKTKPERATYLIWATIDIVTVSSYIVAGARATIWAFLVFTFSQLLIFGLSFKYGMGGFSKFDITCLTLALLGIVIWVTTKDALLVLYFGVFVKMLGYLPTIRKVYFLPKTENRLSWTMAAVADLLNLFALTNLRPSLALLPVCCAVADVLVVYLLLFPAKQSKPHRRHKSRRAHRLLAHPVFSKA